MSEPTTPEIEKSQPEINVVLVDKKHVTSLIVFLALMTFISLYFEHDHEAKFERVANERCVQRQELDQLVQHVNNQITEVDERYFGRKAPGWTHERHHILDAYSRERIRLGREQCYPE